MTLVPNLAEMGIQYRVYSCWTIQLRYSFCIERWATFPCEMSRRRYIWERSLVIGQWFCLFRLGRGGPGWRCAHTLPCQGSRRECSELAVPTEPQSAIAVQPAGDAPWWWPRGILRALLLGKAIATQRAVPPTLTWPQHCVDVLPQGELLSESLTANHGEGWGVPGRVFAFCWDHSQLHALEACWSCCACWLGGPRYWNVARKVTVGWLSSCLPTSELIKSVAVYSVACLSNAEALQWLPFSVNSLATLSWWEPRSGWPLLAMTLALLLISMVPCGVRRIGNILAAFFLLPVHHWIMCLAYGMRGIRKTWGNVLATKK